VVFLLRQVELQSGNTFSESKVINPIFVIGNIPGSIRIRRSLGSASGTPLSDNLNQRSSGADGQIGSAGRLQRRTRDIIIANRIKGRGMSNLFNLIPPNRITRIISTVRSIFGTGQDGILAVNDRPEINFDGQFYSTMLWRGFRPAGKLGNPLDVAGAQLRRGNLKGAITTITSGARRVVRGVNVTGPGQQRGDRDDTSLNGWRYFITDNTPKLGESGIDRYMSNSVVFGSVRSGVTGQTSIVPQASIGILNRKPQLLLGPDVKPLSPRDLEQLKDVSSRNNKSSKVIENLQKESTQKQTASNSFYRKVDNKILKISDLPKINQFSLNDVFRLNNNSRNSEPNIDKNPAFIKMRYPELALQSRYEALSDSLKLNVDDQKSTWQQTFNSLTQDRTYGINKQTLNFGGGFKAGDVMPENIGELNIKYEGRGDLNQRGRYFHDDGISTMVYGHIQTKGSTQPTDEDLRSIRTSLGETTDFFFYDFVNKIIVPFRAFLTDMTENVTPTINEQQYIGRIERNIVYVGVVRELSFTFRVQAFSVREMQSVWGKINRLTGMTFPSKYVSGFLVPPFVKLTIGNIFVDQPGYIKSLSYKFDDDNWEIDEKYQAPMGVTVSLSFSIIEKQQMQSIDKSNLYAFYPYGQVRAVAPKQTTPDKKGIPSRTSTGAAAGTGNTTSPGRVSTGAAAQARGQTVATTIDGKRATGPAVARTPTQQPVRQGRPATPKRPATRVASPVVPRTPSVDNNRGDRGGVFIDIGKGNP
jgi:hypothetical protein